MNWLIKKKVGARLVSHTPHPGPLPVKGRGRSGARSRAIFAPFRSSTPIASPSPLNGERAGVRGVTNPVRSHIRQSPTAFTLLELLIAISIFAMVLTAINGVFYTAMRLQHKASHTVEAPLPLH